MMPRHLLAIEQDAKTTKGGLQGVLTGILYLAPANEARPDVNLCAWSTAG
jgi:hypothetical protein